MSCCWGDVLPNPLTWNTWNGNGTDCRTPTPAFIVNETSSCSIPIFLRTPCPDLNRSQFWIWTAALYLSSPPIPRPLPFSVSSFSFLFFFFSSPFSFQRRRHQTLWIQTMAARQLLSFPSPSLLLPVLLAALLLLRLPAAVKGDCWLIEGDKGYVWLAICSQNQPPYETIPQHINSTVSSRLSVNFLHPEWTMFLPGTQKAAANAAFSHVVV